MIYSHKPQRSGRGISSNTNNPPQDPPAPHEDKPLPIVEKSEIISNIPGYKITIETPKKITREPDKSIEIPDIPIDDTTPPVPEECPEDKPIIPKVPLVTDSIPEPKVIDTSEVKVDKQTAPKLSWFRKLVMRIKKFFRR